MKKIGGLLLVLFFLAASYGMYVLLQRYLAREAAAKALQEEQALEEPEEEPAEERDPLQFDTSFSDSLEDVTVQQLDMFHKTMREAESEAGLGRWEHSKAFLRQAIDLTSNAILRARAGKAMGDVLLQEARTEPWPAALAAEQYLQGAIELETDPAHIEAAQEQLTKTRELLYSEQLRTLPETGSRRQMEQMLEAAEPYMASTPEKQMEYKLREANALHQTVRDPSWLADYMAEHPGAEAEQTRKDLTEEAIEQYLWIAENSRGAIRDEAYFRAAQLLVQDKQYPRADRVIQSFLQNEPLVFISETMLLLARIAQFTGDIRKAGHLLTESIARFGLTSEAQQHLLEVVDDMEKAGHYKDAAGILNRLAGAPSMETRALDMRSRAHLLEAAHFEAIKEPEKAEEIYSMLILGNFPPTIKQAAVSRLFDMQLQQKRSEIGMLLIGIQAVEADPDNEYAKNILVQMARTIEELGLPHYARDIYDKIALLGMAASDEDTPAADLPLSIEEATLGTARCLFKSGDELRADYLLRNICNFYGIGPVQSEAAFWWSQIAFNNQQLQEASRRLGLMDLSVLPPIFTAKAKVLDQFINMRLGISSQEIIDPVLHELALIPAAERDFLRHYYRTFFDIWEGRNDLEAMKAWYRGATKSPHRDFIPADYFFYRIANKIMQQEGLAGVLRYINSLQDMLGAARRNELMQALMADRLADLQQLGLANRAIGQSITDLLRQQRQQN